MISSPMHDVATELLTEYRFWLEENRSTVKEAVLQFVAHGDDGEEMAVVAELKRLVAALHGFEDRLAVLEDAHARNKGAFAEMTPAAHAARRATECATWLESVISALRRHGIKAQQCAARATDARKNAIHRRSEQMVRLLSADPRLGA